MLQRPRNGPALIFLAVVAVVALGGFLLAALSLWIEGGPRRSARSLAGALPRQARPRAASSPRSPSPMNRRQTWSMRSWFRPTPRFPRRTARWRTSSSSPGASRLGSRSSKRPRYLLPARAHPREVETDEDRRHPRRQGKRAVRHDRRIGRLLLGAGGNRRVEQSLRLPQRSAVATRRSLQASRSNSSSSTTPTEPPSPCIPPTR